MRDEKEVFGARHISESCVCKTCINANGSPPYADNWRKSSCIVYPDPQTKPADVYYDGADCEFYERG